MQWNVEMIIDEVKVESSLTLYNPHLWRKCFTCSSATIAF